MAKVRQVVWDVSSNFVSNRYFSRLLTSPWGKMSVREMNKAASETAPVEELLISESCVKRLKEIANDGSCLRVTVEGGGCSGFQYKFDLDSTINDDDRVFHKDGTKIIVDSTSLEYLKGATIDYHTELIRSAFRIINNPLAEHGCSCGSSFTIKLD